MKEEIRILQTESRFSWILRPRPILCASMRRRIAHAGCVTKGYKNHNRQSTGTMPRPRWRSRPRPIQYFVRTRAVVSKCAWSCHGGNFLLNSRREIPQTKNKPNQTRAARFVQVQWACDRNHSAFPRAATHVFCMVVTSALARTGHDRAHN